jgi:hypothetical protein
MRLSVVALLIALPAAAYAAVYPRQPSPYPGDTCGGVGSPCQKNQECCPGFACEQPLDFKIGRVCFIVYLLRFTLGADLNAELPRLLGPSRRRNSTYVGIIYGEGLGHSCSGFICLQSSQLCSLLASERRMVVFVLSPSY